MTDNISIIGLSKIFAGPDGLPPTHLAAFGAALIVAGWAPVAAAQDVMLS